MQVKELFNSDEHSANGLQGIIKRLLDSHIRSVYPFFLPLIKARPFRRKIYFHSWNIIITDKTGPETGGIILLPSAPSGNKSLGIGLIPVCKRCIAGASAGKIYSAGKRIIRMRSKQAVHLAQDGNRFGNLLLSNIFRVGDKGLFIMSVCHLGQP